MKQIERNKEKLWEEIENLCSRPINRANATELGTYLCAYKAHCMVCEAEEEARAARSGGQATHTPELDGDTEFERILMKIPMDGEHITEVFKIFNTHMDQMESVNPRAYNRIIDRLKGVAGD